LGEIDTKQLHELATKVIGQIDFKKGIQTYLSDRMNAVAPNLTSLIGENVIKYGSFLK
jgi:nucleolar protein 56